MVLTAALHLMILYTPFFNDLFSTQPLTWAELGLTVAVSSAVFWAVELQKFIGRRRSPRPVVRLPERPEGTTLPLTSA